MWSAVNRVLSDLPIGRKLSAVMLGASGLALVVALAVFVAMDRPAFKRGMVRDLGGGWSWRSCRSTCATSSPKPSVRSACGRSRKGSS